MSDEDGGWKVVAAAARGARPSVEGRPCEDAHAHECVGPWLLAVVCDGAGSAARGGEGARLSSQTIVCELARALRASRAAEEPDSEGLRSPVRDAIRAARCQLRQVAEAGAFTLTDFDATVVGAAVGAEGGLLFHVGDGVGVGIEGDAWSNARISAPENGDFVEETYFITRDDWEAHLRFTSLPASVDLVALMSDGTAPFAMAHGHSGIEPEFFVPVTRYLDEVDVENGARALRATLDDPRARAITGDDRTLLWARRIQP